MRLTERRQRASSWPPRTRGGRATRDLRDALERDRRRCTASTARCCARSSRSRRTTRRSRGSGAALVGRFVDATRERIEAEQAAGRALPGPAHATAFALVLDGRARVLPAARPGRAGRRATSSSTRSPAIFERTVYGTYVVRVWVDLTNTAHVVVLRPLVELLEARRPRGRADRAAAVAHASSCSTTGATRTRRSASTAACGGPTRRARPPTRARRMVALRPRARAVRRRARPRLDRPADRLARCCGSRTRRCSTTSSRSPSTTSTAGWRTACSCPRRSRPSACARFGARGAQARPLPGAEGGVRPARLRARPRRARRARRRPGAAARRRAHGAVVRALPRRRRRRRCCRGCCARLDEQERPDRRARRATPSRRADVRGARPASA